MVIEPLPPLSRFPRLFGVYLAGDTVNYLSPGGVAGEPLKARLSRELLPAGSGLASLTIYKHADMVAQWLFVLAGVAARSLALPSHSPPRDGPRSPASPASGVLLAC